MTAYDPKGVIPACLLPMHADLSIDETSYRSHLRDLAAVDGVDAITTNAHASEVHALTLDEQKRVLDITKDELGDSTAVVAGVQSDGSHLAADIARMAEDRGADCLLMFPPNSLGMNAMMRPEMAIAHFETVAAATSLPMVLFMYPKATLGYPLETLLEICERVPNVKAIKDWSNDAKQHERHIRELRALSRPVKMLTTHSAWLLPSLVLGCDGILSGAGSVIAALQVALFRAVEAKDLDEARRVYDRIYPTTRAFYDEPFVDMHNRMKEALVYLGRIPEAHVRPPLMKLSDEEIAKIARCMDEAGLERETVYAKVA
ncbi:MAG: dihydrodipicolinate synthase family protein [Rhodospirillaceae bacterium]|nr:dihydrodipicolinate synthase family protein [Rhodospirillaceae bacterium]